MAKDHHQYRSENRGMPKKSGNIVRRSFSSILVPISGSFLLILISFVTIAPLLTDGYFPMHDDTQVGRVIGMTRMLAAGEFPVRWVGDLGYGFGYPLFNFYAPLPYYVGGVLNLLVRDSVSATKAMMGVGMLASGLTMFLTSLPRVGPTAALVGSVLYMFGPYRAVNLYVRGAIGELWVFVFFPLVFWGIIDVLSRQRNQARLSFFLPIGLAGAILSHTLMGYVTAMVSVIVIGIGLLARLALRQLDRRVLGKSLAGLFAGLGISAFFWLPAAKEMGFTSVHLQVGGGADFRDHFLCPEQLWWSAWGYGGSTSGCTDGLSFMTGKLTFLIVAIAAVFALRTIRKTAPQQESRLPAIALLLWAGGVWMTTSSSRVVWEIVPGLPFLQYPWRFLGPTLFATSLAGMASIAALPNRTLRIPIATVLIAGTVLLQAKWFQPQYTYPYTNQVAESVEELRFRTSGVSDEYLPPDFSRPRDLSGIMRRVIREEPGITAEVLTDTGADAVVLVTADTDRLITINRVSFPGFRYILNGKQVKPEAVTSSLPQIRVEKGMNKLQILFGDTPIRQFSNILSLTILVIYVWKYDEKEA